MFRIFIVLMLSLIYPATPAFALDPEAARQELQRLNIPVTDDEFLQRVENGDTAAVELLLAAGMDMNSMDECGKPALVVASSKGYMDTVKILLDYGANVNTSTENGVSALMFAARGGFPDIVKLLLEKGADVNAERGTGDTALLFTMYAKGEPDIEVINILLDSGARVDIKTDYGLSPLTLASVHGQTQAVEALLLHGANADEIVEIDNQTPLMLAAYSGNIDTVKMLLKYGAKIELEDSYGDSAATLAAAEGHTEVARFLKEKLEDKQDPMTDLMWAVAEGDIAKVRELLAENADVNAQDKSGKSALSYAVHNGNKHIVEALLAGSADVNIKDNYGQTPLIVAAYNGDYEIMKVLLENGAAVNAQENTGRAALYYGFGTIEMVELLLKHGADPNLGDDNGEVPLFGVQHSDSADAKVRILLDAGANVNVINKEGQTPLDLAEEMSTYPYLAEENPEVIRILKAAGAKTSAEILAESSDSGAEPAPVGAEDR